MIDDISSPDSYSLFILFDSIPLPHSNRKHGSSFEQMLAKVTYLAIFTVRQGL